MSNRKKRQKPVGVTAFDDSFFVSPAAISPIVFPDSAVRKRVVLERPAPPPVIRYCPYCGATFEDYTQRWNTTYCRASCRTSMSKLKKRLAIPLLAQLTNVPESVAADVADMQGLPAVDTILSKYGYRFEGKQWKKQDA